MLLRNNSCPSPFVNYLSVDWRGGEMKRLVIMGFGLMFLISCFPSEAFPTKTSVTAGKVTRTHEPAVIPPTHTPSPTEVPKKSVRISYSYFQGDGGEEILSCLNAYVNYRFVLYDDGQLILFDNSKYYESMLTQNEVEDLIGQITDSGFLSLEGDGDQYVEGYATPFFQGNASALRVDGRSISFQYSDQLALPLQISLEKIFTFKPDDLKLYVPNEAVLWVYREDYMPDSFYLFHEPSKTEYVWTQSAFDLYPFALASFSNELTVITGEQLSFVMKHARGIPDYFLVRQTVGQQELNYHVFVCPNFFY
jgi:hypothetical protein